MSQQTARSANGEPTMTYDVHVQGRRNNMRFPSYSKADAYRRVMLAAGLFARIV